MKKELLKEIDARIRVCLEAEDKLEYIDSLFRKKKISRLEHDVLKQNILKNKPEHEVRREINDYVEKAVLLKNKFTARDSGFKIAAIMVGILFLFSLVIVLRPTTVGYLSLKTDLNSPIHEKISLNEKLKSSDNRVNVVKLDRKSNRNYDAEIEINSTSSGKNKLVLRGIDSDKLDAVKIYRSSDKKVKTDIIYVNKIDLSSATIYLAKTAKVNSILKCENWNSKKEICSGEWTESGLPFEQNSTHVWFTADGFSAYAGADITIINVQSYPVVGGDWIVYFNTTGKANLTMTAINGTEWSNSDDIYDLRLDEIKCGQDIVSYSWINNGPENSTTFVSDYECNETSYERSKVFTTGKHHLKFTFGDDVGYANNLATSAVVITSLSLSTTEALNEDNISITTITNDGNTRANITDWMNDSKSITLFNYWFEPNASRNATDYSTNKKHLTTITNSPVYGPTIGLHGSGAYDFDGSNDRMILPAPEDYYFSSKFSIEVWVNLSGVPGAGTGDGVVGKYFNVTPVVVPWSLWITNNFLNANYGATCGRYNGGWVTAGSTNSGAVLTTGKWYHLVCTWDGDKFRMYTNGVLKGTSGSTSLTDNDDRPSIGAFQESGTWTYFTDGAIDNLAYYNSTLKLQQILEHNSSGLRQTIHNQTTKIGEVWSVKVCPADSTQVGTCKYSNNVTIVSALSDAEKPLVFDAYPRNGTRRNVSTLINISANVTDNSGVSSVSANITRPGGATDQVTLKLSTANRYNNSYTIPAVAGRYNVTYLATDTSNNKNWTVKRFFNVSAVLAVSNVILNSTHRTNYTIDNLTVYWSSIGPERVINITDWRVNDISFAILNTPFERNLTYNASDYSTFKKHANRVFEATWFNTCRRTNTACYKFDGTNDHINISDSVMPTKNMTISFFLNATDITSKAGLITKWLNGTSASWAVEQNGTLRMYVSDGTAAYTANYAQTGKVFDANKWYHVAVIFNGSASSANKVLFYVDGKQKTGSVVGAIPSTLQDDTSMLTIGGYSGEISRFAAAWIDDIKIFNRTLSVDQIRYLNLSRNDVTVYKELKSGENWSVAVTPTDSGGSGATKHSNNVTIRQFTFAISNIQTTFDNESAVINWSTNANSNTSVNYGTSKALGTKRTVQNSVTSHNVTLTQLNFGTKYFYNVSSCSAYSCTVSGPNNFTTLFNLFVNINSTHGRNLTSENITAHYFVSSTSTVFNITDWRVYGTTFSATPISYAIVYFPFENSTVKATDYSYPLQTNGTVGSDIKLKTKANSVDGKQNFGGYYNWSTATGGATNQITFTGTTLGTSFTISMWVKPTASTASFQCLACDNAQNPQGFTYSGTTRLINYYYSGSHTSTSTLTVGAWNHVVLRLNSGKTNFFINGVKDASTYTSSPALKVNRIGHSAGADVYVGGIDDFRVYNRTLNESEIIQLSRNRTDIIVSQETSLGQNWTACVTPANTSSVGTALCSNNITIRGAYLNITAIYPNQTGQSQVITDEINNISITRNFSRTNNLTFNATANADYRPLTFRWFINLVLKYTEVVTSGFTSTFKWLFNTTGKFNVTVKVNGSDAGINDTFRFALTTSANVLPLVNNVRINSTHGTNYTNENLTVYWNSTDINNQKIINITDWRVNGNSIAVLNMPFEADGRKNATDYSTPYQNNGTTSGSPYWNKTGGYKGTGAYRFDGKNDKITTSLTGNPARTTITLSVWYKPALLADQDNFLSFGLNTKNISIFYKSVTNLLRWYTSVGASFDDLSSGITVVAGSWYHIVAVYNGTTKLLYVNGVLKNSIAESIIFTTNNVVIGADINGASYWANGTIDDVRIYNRSLSANEIKLLNLSKDNIMHSDETTKNQNWTACITPNDGNADGTRVCSNNITIRNSIPTTSVQIAPNTANDTLIYLNVTFNWTVSTDKDNDPITYYVNITSLYCANQEFTTSTVPFVSPELSTVDVCGYYNWSVRAYDGTSFSVNSGLFNFSIQPYVNITLTQNSSDFGLLNPGQSNDTTDENPPSFVVESNGNVLVNVTVRGLDDLWDTEALGSNSFMYKSNATEEANSFDTDNSQNTFRAVTGSATKAIKELKRVRSTNTARIQFNVTVPATESPGLKKSNVILEASQS